MALPDVLEEWTTTLKTDIQNARATNWRLLRRNSETYIEILLGLISPTAEIDAACDVALKRVREYADLIGGLGPAFSPEDPAASESRDSALKAVIDLELALQNAKPSKEALILRLF